MNAPVARLAAWAGSLVSTRSRGEDDGTSGQSRRQRVRDMLLDVLCATFVFLMLAMNAYWFDGLGESALKQAGIR